MSAPTAPLMILPCDGFTARVVDTPGGKQVEVRLTNTLCHAVIVLEHASCATVLDGIAKAHAETSGLITAPRGIVTP